MKKISRRTLLRGAGGAALSLPLLEAMTRAPLRADMADGLVNGQIKRFITVFKPNGVLGPSFFPSAGASFEGTNLAPIEAFRDRTLVLDGLKMQSALDSSGEQHQTGMGSVLTGMRLQETGEFLGGAGRRAGWGNGISIDQRIADRIKGTTRYKSLHLGVVANHIGSEVRSRMSYNGPADPISPVDSPRRAFDSLFNGLDLNAMMDDPAQIAARARRQKVVDAVQDQFARVKTRVSTEDRRRLDRHLTFINELEDRIGSSAMATGAVCMPGQRPTDPNIERYSNFPELSRAHIDILVSAFACDLTRVGSLQYNTAVSFETMPWIGDNQPGHPVGHACSRPGEPLMSGNGARNEANRKWNRRVEWYMGEVAYLLQRLRDTPEGDGNLLDSTAVLLVSDLSNPQHRHTRMPFVLMGNAGGALQSGVRVYGDGGDTAFNSMLPHNRMLIGLAQAYGVDIDQFGEPEYCQGGVLPNMLA